MLGVIEITPWHWGGFVLCVVFFLALDLGVFHREAHVVKFKEALAWTTIWVTLSFGFGLLLAPALVNGWGRQDSVEFITGYIIELSLSVDNLFVFIMIFSLMGVHEKNQPRLLKLGILLSIVLRILFILVGMGLVQRFGWILYVFGALLIWTAWKMAFTAEDDHVDPKNNILYKQASKMFPVDPDPHTPRFFTKIDGKIHITSVLLVFLVIGSTDVLFAIDSIPAIIGVIKEGASNVLTLEEENFIAITSNVFAVMGLVSLFFGLKGIMGMFRYLKHGVSFILFFIGVKMMLGFIPAVEHFFKAHSWVSLAVIVATLMLSVVLSAIIKEEVDEAVKAEKATASH
mgnify:CR=1 FL=1